jgi:acetone carboxylase beta subunit
MSQTAALRRKPVVCYTDVGGTFTDCFVVDANGEFVLGKAPSTPDDIAEGFLDSLTQTWDELEMTQEEFLSALEVVGYGATTVLNSVLTRQGGQPGMLITRGFEDLLLMERGKQSWIGLSRVDRIHPVTHRHQAPLIPRSRVCGVSERIDSLGREIIPLREGDVRESVEGLLGQGVDSVVILFLWSFLADEHERRAKEIVQEVIAEHRASVQVFCSSEISPTLRELPRANATVIEAFSGPSTLHALARIETDLKYSGFTGNLQVMQSAGGLAPAAHVRAIDTAMSGPVGGLVGTRYIGELYEIPNLISTDVGGTSFDVGLITDGFIGVDREPVLAGWLLSLPMMEVDSIGAGGGTIARIDPLTGRLQVGPDSAGAVPGPVCYGTGGTEPTVTDADLVLGYLSGRFIGGRITGDVEAARQTIGSKIANPLGLSVEAAADGIRQVIDAKMREAVVGLVSLRGFALEDYLLLGFGGAGPTHVCGYTNGLKLKGVLTFPYASVFSAFGAASADYEHHYHRAVNVVVPPKATDDDLVASRERISAAWQRLEEQALEQMRREGIDVSTVRLRHLAMVRYGKQLNDLIVTSPVSRVATADDLRKVIGAFEELYAHIYAKGAQFPQAGYEVFEVGLVATALKVKPRLVAHTLEGTDASAAKIAEQPAWFDDGWNPTPRYDWMSLRPGNIVSGPAVIEHPTTTLVVPPAKSARVDEYRTVWLEEPAP